MATGLGCLLPFACCSQKAERCFLQAEVIGVATTYFILTLMVQVRHPQVP